MVALRAWRLVLGSCLAFTVAAALAPAQPSANDAPVAEAPAGDDYRPYDGQPGQDTPWVPTPDHTVRKMLDMGGVTADDYVVDLGSGDGRLVIAAAVQRGARGHGVEFNPDLVAYSNRRAHEAGVADRVEFVQGDMFEADISRATVLLLFLLPDNLDRLVPTFLSLRPGTRIVLNHFTPTGWDHDEADLAAGEECETWCEVYLYYVPARVAGTWRLGNTDLVINQTFQRLTGTLGGAPVEDGRLRGDEIAFTVAGVRYAGRVSGDAMQGTFRGSVAGTWRATRGDR